MLSELWGNDNEIYDDESSYEEEEEEEEDDLKRRADIELAHYSSSSSSEDEDEDEDDDDDSFHKHRKEEGEEEEEEMSVASEMENLVSSLEHRVHYLEHQRIREHQRSKLVLLLFMFSMICVLIWYNNNGNYEEIVVIGGTMEEDGGIGKEEEVMYEKHEQTYYNTLKELENAAKANEEESVVGVVVDKEEEEEKEEKGDIALLKEEVEQQQPPKEETGQMNENNQVMEQQQEPPPPPPPPPTPPPSPPPTLPPTPPPSPPPTPPPSPPPTPPKNEYDPYVPQPPPPPLSEQTTSSSTTNYDPYTANNVPKYDPFAAVFDTSTSSSTSNLYYPTASESGGWELHTTTSSSSSSSSSPENKNRIDPNNMPIIIDPVLKQRYQELDNGLSDVSMPYDREKNLAVFWHVPKCGGTSLEDLLSHCIGLVEANEIGITDGHKHDKTLTVVNHDGSQYVNVDTTTQDGIKHAKELHLASSGLADVAMTSYLYDIATLFNNNNNNMKGKCFTLLRHPIKRAVSLFYYLKVSTWENDYNSVFSGMSIEEYARSKYCEQNWMVRFLTNEMKGPLTEDHLILAMKVLQNKCFVGLLDKFDASLSRFEMYFGWTKDVVTGNDEKKQKECVQKLEKQHDNVNVHPVAEEGDEVWNLLMQKNLYDMRLYEFALDLYEEFSGYG